MPECKVHACVAVTQGDREWLSERASGEYRDEREMQRNRNGQHTRDKCGWLHAQARSLSAFCIALALPFSFSLRRRMDSSIVRMSSPAFLASSKLLTLYAVSSAWSISSSSVGGTVSGGLLKRAERIEGRSAYEETADDMT